MFERSHVIKLTMAVYKVSDLFPEQEPLKVLIRKKADEILAGLTLSDKDINKNIEVMNAYFELAENLGFAKKENFDILKKEYKLLTPSVNKHVDTRCQQQEINLNLSARHKKIIEILKKGNPIQVKNLKDIFPDISKRTIRRDFEYLLANGLVDRVGDNNNTEYKLKSK